MIKNYEIEEKYSIACATNSKGIQKKYFKDGWYYKLDTEGGEGVREWLASCVLKCSSLQSWEYVEYAACKINGKSGCRSHSFLQPNESFLAIGRLFTMVTGKNSLAEHLATMSEVEDRLNYILYLVKDFIEPSLFKRYLCKLMQFDLLIENSDRHEFNYGLILTGDHCRIAPIFDNGNCLMEGSPCTLCGSYLSQVTAFGFPDKEAFTIDYGKLQSLLAQSSLGNSLYAQRLQKNLKEYDYLFKTKSNRDIF